METMIIKKYKKLKSAVREMQLIINEYPDVYFDADDYDTYRWVKTEMNGVVNSTERLGDWIEPLNDEQCKKALQHLIDS